MSEHEAKPTALHAELHDRSASAAGKYRRLTVGDRGLLYFCYYELVTMLFSWMPGALGFLLRSLFYRPLFAELGRGSVIGQYVTIRHPHKIRLAPGSALGDYVSLDAMGGGASGIELGENVLIGRNTVLSAKGGRIVVGEGTNIGMNCLVIARDSEVRVGGNTLFAAYCYLMGGGVHGFERIDLPIMEQHLPSRGVTVGSDCWLGAGVKVADGVRVGDGSVVGAGAVVLESLPPLSVAYGIPARVSRTRGHGSTGEDERE
jgi:acetyltransferase-like isoleucine patch superfamily enzyme